MKLQPDQSNAPSITGSGPGWVDLNGERITSSVIIGSKGQRLHWAAGSFTDLTPRHFAQLAELGCEIVIFGSGSRIRFPQAAWLVPLMAKGVGLETMGTAAACRTYNILAQEGRDVAVALLLEQPA